MLFEETVGLDSLPREEFNRRKASRIVDRRHDFLAVRSFGTPTDRASWVSASSFVGVDVIDIKDYSFDGSMGDLTKCISGSAMGVRHHTTRYIRCVSCLSILACHVS